MSNSIRALLRSSDPKQRMQGIQQVVQNPNANTPRLLTSIAEKDPDASVRAYAQKAAQHLQNIPKRNPNDILQEANFFLDEANNAMFEGDTQEARTFARRAFKLVPQLRQDDIARDVAVYVMKMPADDAIDLLLSDRDLFEIDKTFRKKVGYHYSDEGLIDRFFKHFRKWNVSGHDIIVDFVLYLLVIIPSLIIERLFYGGYVVSTYSANLLLSWMGLASGEGGVQEFSPAFIIVALLIDAIRFFGFLIIQMLLIHTSATLALGGDGSLKRLIHHWFIPLTAYTIFQYFLYLMTFLLYAVGMGQLVEAGMLQIVMIIGLGVLIYNLSQAVGNVYQFDLGKGCLAMIFPYLAYICFIITVVILRFGTELRESSLADNPLSFIINLIRLMEIMINSY